MILVSFGAELQVVHGVVAAVPVPGAEYHQPGAASLGLDEASANQRLGFVGVLDADGHHGLRAPGGQSSGTETTGTGHRLATPATIEPVTRR